MFTEYETQRDKSYFFFSICPKCKSIYEGLKDKNNNLLESKWFNNN